jgi:hypothetical protein
MHSIMTFETSRVRAKPPSSIMKPACMKNTRNAVMHTHAVFRPLIVPWSWAFRSVAALCTGVALATRVLKR